MAAITVAAPSQMPSVAKHPFSSTGADTPFAASTTSRIYTSLTDVTPHRGLLTAVGMSIRWLGLALLPLDQSNNGRLDDAGNCPRETAPTILQA
jgi:hypothetical protein